MKMKSWNEITTNEQMNVKYWNLFSSLANTLIYSF